MEVAGPHDYEKALTRGAQRGSNARSIIAKAKREGIPYIAKAVPTAKRKGPTKKDMVNATEKENGFILVGLAHAPVRALANLIAPSLILI